MEAVILAAGSGSRMGGVAKPLVRVGGIEILRRTVILLSPYVTKFVVVAGIYHDQISKFLEDLKRELGIEYEIVRNENPELGNGYSLYLAKNLVGDRFVLVMGDHVYGRDFVEEAVKGDGLIGDREARYVNLSEATKVKVTDGRVERAAKDLEDYDCIDTGFFILSRDVFGKIEEMIGELREGKREIKLSDVISEAKIPVSFVDGKFWMDVDVKEDIRRANYLLVKTSVKGRGDGFVSRYINRRISTYISSLLINRITPSQMTVASFILGLISSLLLFFNIYIGAIVYQFSSILDGCDGEIARASLRVSRIGGYVDSILDRIVDFSFLVVLTVMNPEYAVLAIFAVFGSVMVSYTTEKYKAEFNRSITDDVREVGYLIGKRDERIFLTMLLLLLNRIYELFVIIIAVSFFRFLGTLALVLNHRKRL